MHAALCTTLLLVLHVSSSRASGDNWAVIVSSSRYWLNYRHSSNAFGVYQAIRRCATAAVVVLDAISDSEMPEPSDLASPRPTAADRRGR